MLPPEDDPRLAEIVKKVVTGYRLEHAPSFTILHIMLLGHGCLTRKDYNEIIRAYCNVRTENHCLPSGGSHALPD